MVSKSLLIRLYDAASMHRWNDQIRTVDLTELDKQAHKMMIAFVLAKSEKKEVSWLEIIESGFFEFLQRIVLTDLKPPLFHRIKEDRKKYRELNEWVFKKIQPLLLSLGGDFSTRFKDYLFSKERSINRRIISAAHFYATKWEFDIIKRANPQGYLIEEIQTDIESKQKQYQDLNSMSLFLNDNQLKDFIDICGRLRFQIRWSHVHRVPKTSVLGHMLIVAMVSYLFSLENKSGEERCINNYFTGLFHDLPEVLTRDVISPVKRSVEGLDDLIKDYEKEEMQRTIYKLLPGDWHSQIRMYTEDEFRNLEDSTGSIIRDGYLLKAVDDLAAFIEVYLAFNNGIHNRILEEAKSAIMDKYKNKLVQGVDFGRIYRDFFS
jgi:putative hydrolases of HD superfamily